MTVRRDMYDCVIIGSGIGGLVCGCYLAKAGLKTLILEKNSFPGGYASSFERGGHFFDSCVHSLGGCERGGEIGRVMDELSLSSLLKFNRYDPSDRITTPDFFIDIRNDFHLTINDLCSLFSNESKKIREFFRFILNADKIKIIALRRATFLEVLNNYFKSKKLKSIFSILVLGNLGLPASRLSAIVAINFFKQFVIDGGYYPKGGIQAFPNSLVRRFKDCGGKIVFQKHVKEITISGGIANGVKTSSGESFKSKFIISDCDVISTFLSIPNFNLLNKEIKSRLSSMQPSLSMFILYLAVRPSLLKNFSIGTNFWNLEHYNIDLMYENSLKGDLDNFGSFLVRRLNKAGSMMSFINAPYVNDSFWKNHKSHFINTMTKKIAGIIPGFSSGLLFADAATPCTLKKYTSNYNGAAYGWAATPDQFTISGFSVRTPIKNLLLSGHWSTVARGIPGVTFLGRTVANHILSRRER